MTSADATLTEAFDLELGDVVDLTRERPAHGWCYGLPPAIGPDRWPMSPTLGIPLRHAFTVVVPEPYRAQNEHLIALSLFVDDQFEKAEAVGETEFHANDTRTFLMEDILGCKYVGIWLTAEELAAPLGAPPPSNAPWMTQTPSDYYGASELPRHVRDSAWTRLPAQESLKWGMPIAVTPRQDDPNIGKPAREWDHQNKESGYVTAFSDAGVELNLERFHGRTAHFGGTMFPIQGYPDFTPYYLELEEQFGGFNFGGGCGQIDLKLMQLDWACG